jgi:hypothetical protein
MSLHDLLHQNISKYIVENRRSDQSWFFVHIPKTGGTSLVHDVTQACPLSCNIHVDDADDRAIPHGEKLAEAVRKFSAEYEVRKFTWGSGHVPVAMLLAEVDQWRDFSLATMLRNPIARVISDYRYQRTPLHARHKEFIAEFPTFWSYAETPHARNKMYQFLRPHGGASLDETIDFIIFHFSFVGILEHYETSFRVLTHLLGHSRFPNFHDRRTPDIETNSVNITEEGFSRLRNLNALDIYLYDFFSAVIAPLEFHQIDAHLSPAAALQVPSFRGAV